MSGSFSYIGMHFVFSTKNRANIINSEIKERLYSYIGGIIKSLQGIPIAINGMSDHIHIFCIISREITIADFMRTIKSKSSKWVNETFLLKPKFQWQDGYASFSVSKSAEDKIIEYIRSQEKPHWGLNYMELTLSGIVSPSIALHPFGMNHSAVKQII